MDGYGNYCNQQKRVLTCAWLFRGMSNDNEVKTLSCTVLTILPSPYQAIQAGVQVQFWDARIAFWSHKTCISRPYCKQVLWIRRYIHLCVVWHSTKEPGTCQHSLLLVTMDGYGNYCSSHYNERGPPSKQFMKSSANVRFVNSDQKGERCAQWWVCYIKPYIRGKPKMTSIP